MGGIKVRMPGAGGVVREGGRGVVAMMSAIWKVPQNAASKMRRRNTSQDKIRGQKTLRDPKDNFIFVVLVSAASGWFFQGGGGGRRRRGHAKVLMAANKARHKKRNEGLRTKTERRNVAE